MDEIEAGVDIGRHPAARRLDEHAPGRRRPHVARTDRRRGIDDHRRQAAFDHRLDEPLGGDLAALIGADALRFVEADALVGRRALAQRQGGDAARVDDALDAGGVRRLHRVACPLDIGGDDLLRVSRPEPIIGGDMEEIAHALHRRGHRRGIAHVADGDLDAARQVRARARSGARARAPSRRAPAAPRPPPSRRSPRRPSPARGRPRRCHGAWGPRAWREQVEASRRVKSGRPSGKARLVANAAARDKGGTADVAPIQRRRARLTTRQRRASILTVWSSFWPRLAFEPRAGRAGARMTTAQETNKPQVAAGLLDAATLAKNFADLHPPLSRHEALVEAERCYFCYDAPCQQACPTSIDIPLFIREIAAEQPARRGEDDPRLQHHGRHVRARLPDRDAVRGSLRARGGRGQAGPDRPVAALRRRRA